MPVILQTACAAEPPEKTPEDFEIIRARPLAFCGINSLEVISPAPMSSVNARRIDCKVCFESKMLLLDFRELFLAGYEKLFGIFEFGFFAVNHLFGSTRDKIFIREFGCH